MDWSIDTGALGARGCDVSELRGILEAAAAHFCATAPDGAENQVLLAMNTESKDPAFMKQATHAAAVAKAQVIAKLPAIQKQIAAGIKAACDLADDMGGQVTCTVAGHHYPEHSCGIFKRMQVFVDRAAPVEED